MSLRQKAELDRLIYALADKKTEEVEVIAALPAVWVQPAAAHIISGVRENWHDAKHASPPLDFPEGLIGTQRKHHSSRPQQPYIQKKIRF